MTDNVIYAYKKRSTNKIVYVGQTTNLSERHKHHVQYDPFNMNCREYDYPLSRGIRKYGEDEQELDDREKYWIKYYDTYFNGYNQTVGGANPTFPTFTEDKIDQVIEMLKDESYSYNDIIAKTGVSLTHVYNINVGKRRKRDDIQYPIRPANAKGTKGLKFSQEECKRIHEEILNTNKSYKELGQEFGCRAETISDISNGRTQRYVLEGYTYPLRVTSQSKRYNKE